MLYVVDEVRGVTHLDNILYGVCFKSSTVHRYNTDTHCRLDDISVNGQGDPLDIVVCRDDRQLYIAKFDCIWRVSVDDQSSVRWLETPFCVTQPFICMSMSLTSRRLLVTSIFFA